MTFLRVFDKFPPWLGAAQCRRVTNNPQRVFSTGNSDVHATNVFHETGATGSSPYTTVYDNILLAALETYTIERHYTNIKT